MDAGVSLLLAIGFRLLGDVHQREGKTTSVKFDAALCIAFGVFSVFQSITAIIAVVFR